MHILQTHDAYYCADPLITGPTKKIQPQLFTYNQVKVFIFLYAMHLKQRKAAFRGQPIKLTQELIRFFAQSFFNLNYVLLLVIKNFSFRNFIEAGGLLKRSALFFISWAGMFLLYPIVFPALKIIAFGKENMALIRKKKGAHTPFTFARSDFDVRSRAPWWNSHG